MWSMGFLMKQSPLKQHRGTKSGSELTFDSKNLFLFLYIHVVNFMCLLSWKCTVIVHLIFFHLNYSSAVKCINQAANYNNLMLLHRLIVASLKWCKEIQKSLARFRSTVKGNLPEYILSGMHSFWLCQQ